MRSPPCHPTRPDRARGIVEPVEILEQRARGGDPERDVLGQEPLVGRVDVGVGQREAGDDRRDAPIGERGTIGSVPPLRISSGRTPSARSNAASPSATGARVRGDEARREAE